MTNELYQAVETLRVHIEIMSLNLSVIRAEIDKAIGKEIAKNKRLRKKPTSAEANAILGTISAPLIQYKGELADDLDAAIDIARQYKLAMPNCRKLSEALRGVDLPDPSQFRLDAMVEVRELLNRIRGGQPDSDPFVLVARKHLRRHRDTTRKHINKFDWIKKSDSAKHVLIRQSHVRDYVEGDDLKLYLKT